MVSQTLVVYLYCFLDMRDVCIKSLEEEKHEERGTHCDEGIFKLQNMELIEELKQ